MITATVAVISVTGSCCTSFVYGSYLNIVCVYIPILFEKSLHPGG